MINEPKYDLEQRSDSKIMIVNAMTGEPIPDDEPIMIFRAKDRHAMGAISAYMDLIHEGEHMEAVHARFVEFSDFSTNHPDRMKEPDTPIQGRE